MEREKILLTLASLRRVTLGSAVVIAITGAASFFFSKEIINCLLQVTKVKIYYFQLPEAFIASVEIALFSGIFLSVPLILFLIWHELRNVVTIKPYFLLVFLFSSIFLFYVGSFFSVFIVLPSGIRFLLSYGTENNIAPMISVQKFTIFSIAMIFAFGITFELPIILMSLGKLGIMRSATLTKTRRYAILVITIAAAIITPTPDAYNMALLAAPAYILYEIGIMLMKISENRKNQK